MAGAPAHRVTGGPGFGSHAYPGPGFATQAIPGHSWAAHGDIGAAPRAEAAAPAGQVHFQDLARNVNASFDLFCTPSLGSSSPAAPALQAAAGSRDQRLGKSGQSAFDAIFFEGLHKRLRESEEVELREQLRSVDVEAKASKGKHQDLEREVAGLSADLKACSAKHVEELSKHGKQLGDLQAHLEAQLRDLRRSLEGQVTESSRRLQDTRGELAELVETVGGLKGRLLHHDTLHATHASNHSSMSERIDNCGLDRSLRELAQRQLRKSEEVDARFEELTTQVSQVDSKVGVEARAAAETVRRVAADLEQAIEATETRTQLARDIEALQASFGSHVSDANTQFRALQKMRASVETRLSRLETDDEEIQVVKGEVRKMIGRMAVQMEEFRTCKTDMHDIKIHIEAHAHAVGRMAALEAEVGDSTRKHQADLKAVCDRVDRASGRGEAFDTLRQDHSELSRQVDALARQHTLQGTRVGDLESSVHAEREEQLKRVEDVRVASGAAANECRGLVQQQALLSGKVDRAMAAQGANEDRVGQLERKVEDAAERHAREIRDLADDRRRSKDLADLRGELTGLVHGRHAPLEESIAETRRAVTDVRERAIAEIREKQVAASADHQQRVQDLRAQLDEQASTSAEQRRQLQELKAQLAEGQASVVKSTADALSAKGEEWKDQREEIERRLEGVENHVKDSKRKAEALAQAYTT